MSFQGADVDGLDRLAQYTNDAADFADSVAKALEIIVAALEAMSWTGWAAAFAAYLRGVVIPWVKTTARYLRTFAAVLALTSKEQKQVSGDMPYVALPTGSYTPVSYPTSSAVIAPSLRQPDVTITIQTAGGGAAGDHVRITAPAGIGQIGPANGGAAGGGSRTTTPGGVGGVSSPGGGAAGGGAAVNTPTAPIAPAPSGGGATGGGSAPGAPGLPGLSVGGPHAGVSTGSGSAWTAGPGLAGLVGGSGSGGGSGSVGSGGGSGPGSGGGSWSADSGTGALAGGSGAGGTPSGSGGAPSGPVASGSGGLGGTTGADGGAPVRTGGDAPVTRTPIVLGGGGSGGLGGSGSAPLPAVPLNADGGGLSPALVAAPLGLAGLGAAALGAARGAMTTDEDDDGAPAEGGSDHRPAGRSEGGAGERR